MKQATLTFKTTQDSNKTFKLEGSVESIQWTAQYLKSHCNVYDVASRPCDDNCNVFDVVVID